MTAKPSSQITRSVPTSAALASTAKVVTPNVASGRTILTHLSDGREETESVLTINPV